MRSIVSLAALALLLAVSARAPAFAAPTPSALSIDSSPIQTVSSRSMHHRRMRHAMHHAAATPAL